MCQCVQAADLLLFLLLGMQLPWQVLPALPATDTARLRRWYAAIRLRQFACMSALNCKEGNTPVGAFAAGKAC
jgi:hypothetical protein